MKLRFLLLFIGIAIPSIFYAQDKQNGNAVHGTDAEYAFEQVDVKPEFPNGNDGLVKYLSENIKYPKDAVKQKIQGRVLVTFVVDTDGSIQDVKVAKAVYPSIDKESVRVVKKMPKWTPGKKDGCPVRVQYTLPIAFHL